MLTKSPAALDYLRGRGIAHAASEAFSLGFAPDAWDMLVGFLTRQGVALADAERAGLVSKNDRGGYFDKLRGRLIFPIFDVQDRPIAFGGRLLGEAGPGSPKYWNSPETPVFSKSRTLYGLGRARKAIADAGRAVVVEGYTDVVAAHQAGFENVVATLGTSLDRGTRQDAGPPRPDRAAGLRRRLGGPQGRLPRRRDLRGAGSGGARAGPAGRRGPGQPAPRQQAPGLRAGDGHGHAAHPVPAGESDPQGRH